MYFFAYKKTYFFGYWHCCCLAVKDFFLLNISMHTKCGVHEREKLIFNRKIHAFTKRKLALWANTVVVIVCFCCCNRRKMRKKIVMLKLLSLFKSDMQGWKRRNLMMNSKNRACQLRTSSLPCSFSGVRKKNLMHFLWEYDFIYGCMHFEIAKHIQHTNMCTHLHTSGT